MLPPEFDTTFANPIIKGLTYAAIAPGLRSILVFDASYADLSASAAILAELLTCATGREVSQARIGVSELDDDLWGDISLSSDRDESSIIWRRGKLEGLWDPAALRLIVIPDLAKLSLAAARACIMLVNADVAHLERHGQSKKWNPDIYWLAGCTRSEIGSVSPHLLDRFVLRLNWRNPSKSSRVEALLQQILNDEPSSNNSQGFLPSTLKDQIQKTIQRQVILSDEALDCVLYHMPVLQVHGFRRELTLARLAKAVAQFENTSRVTISHVDQAAGLIGLTSDDSQERVTNQPPVTPSEQSAQQNMSSDHLPTAEGYASEQPVLPSTQSDESPSIPEPIYESDQTAILDTTQLPAYPYPEDSAPVEREAASLRLPLSQRRSESLERGVIIGVERARTLHDLSIVSTLLAAAPFQPIRRKHHRMDGHRFLISTTDLRSYRRESVTEQMFVLLIDYTSLRDCEWQQALIPYLHQAYTERASICIVRVGAVKAIHELQAELVHARSILVPTITAALEAERGKASPLAHGLDLALHRLRQSLEHGRNTIRRALFVIISDGRGNIPLEASRRRELIEPINREGVEDTLQVARQIGELKNVQIILLNPQPRFYPDLPLILAQSLKAEVKNIQRLGRMEVEHD